MQPNPSLFRFPGGESVVDSQNRMVQALETIRHNYTDQDLVACFSHADPIKQVIAFYLGLPLDHFARLSIDTASITALLVGAGGSRLLMLNNNPSFKWEALATPVNPKDNSTAKA